MKSTQTNLTENERNNNEKSTHCIIRNISRTQLGREEASPRILAEICGNTTQFSKNRTVDADDAKIACDRYCNLLGFHNLNLSDYGENV